MNIVQTEIGTIALIASGNITQVEFGAVYLGATVTPTSGTNETYTIYFN